MRCALRAASHMAVVVFDFETQGGARKLACPGLHICRPSGAFNWRLRRIFKVKANHKYEGHYGYSFSTNTPVCQLALYQMPGLTVLRTINTAANIVDTRDMVAKTTPQIR